MGAADRVVGKGGKAAVGVQQQAVLAEQVDGALDALGHLVHRFGVLQLLVNHTHADARVLRQALQHGHVARAGRGHLQQVGAHAHLRQGVDQRLVTARQRHGLVGRPVAAADVQRQALARKAFQHRIQQIARKRQLFSRRARFGQRAAHERPLVLGARKHHFGQHRLIKLHQRGAGLHQLGQLFAQHAHDVLGDVFAAGVGLVRNAFHPHGARQQVRPRQRHLHGPLRHAAGKVHFVRDQRARSRQRAEHGGVAHVGGGNVQRAQLGLELFRVIDQRQQIGQRDQLAVVQTAGDKAGVAVAPLLAVGDDIHASAFLRGDGQAHRVVGGLLEFARGKATLHMRMHRLDHPARARPRPHAGHRQRGHARRGHRLARGAQQHLGRPLVRAFRLIGLGGRGGALSQSALTDQKGALATHLGPRHQLVARQAAPGGQVFVHRDFGGADFQQPAARQRVDVLSDQQQQAVAAVKVAAVERHIGRQGVGVDRFHAGGARRGADSSSQIGLWRRWNLRRQLFNQ